MYTRFTISPVRALVIAALAAIVLALLWWPRESQQLFTGWTNGSSEGGLSGEARPVDSIPAGILNMQADSGVYADQRDALRADLEQALGYAIERFGSTPSSTLTAHIVRDDGCSLGGVAYTDIRKMQVSTCDAIPRGRAVAIMAHEFTHQLAQDRYDAAHLRADLILSEGVATWAAGRYWLSGHADFRSFVREQRRTSTSYPLATSYVGRGVDAMNTLYYQWASFVEFLIETYGREAFDQAYMSGANTPGSADYMAAFGKDLATLEREWEVWLGQ